MTMTTLLNFHFSERQRQSVEDFLTLESDEERLEWLMQRRGVHQPVPTEERTSEKRIPGCPSGLWLSHQSHEGKSYFSSYSESAIVQGVTSFICDLYSERSAVEIIEIRDLIAKQLGLERLLSITRKRAIAVLTEFILLKSYAERPLDKAV